MEAVEAAILEVAQQVTAELFGIHYVGPCSDSLAGCYPVAGGLEQARANANELAEDEERAEDLGAAAESLSVLSAAPMPLDPRLSAETPDPTRGTPDAALKAAGAPAAAPAASAARRSEAMRTRAVASVLLGAAYRAAVRSFPRAPAEPPKAPPAPRPRAAASTIIGATYDAVAKRSSSALREAPRTPRPRAAAAAVVGAAYNAVARRSPSAPPAKATGDAADSGRSPAEEELWRQRREQRADLWAEHAALQRERVHLEAKLRSKCVLAPNIRSGSMLVVDEELLRRQFRAAEFRYDDGGVTLPRIAGAGVRSEDKSQDSVALAASTLASASAAADCRGMNGQHMNSVKPAPRVNPLLEEMEDLHRKSLEMRAQRQRLAVRHHLQNASAVALGVGSGFGVVAKSPCLPHAAKPPKQRTMRSMRHCLQAEHLRLQEEHTLAQVAAGEA
eukprot:TRINITY_DN24083_c0_g1_i3.p1 TRINITY_DN24083_c0_g1~~TRINITY_DN24083_c0_g1_i3.p1  ORF type:complete len:447 (-),score=109.28 TRINITY_DN24083_c0_g1_i3:203-1543(-)